MAGMTQMRKLQLLASLLGIRDARPGVTGIVAQSPNIKFMIQNDWDAYLAKRAAGELNLAFCQDQFFRVGKAAYNKVSLAIAKDGYNPAGTTPKPKLRSVYNRSRTLTDMVETMMPSGESPWDGVTHPSRAQFLEMYPE